MIICFINKDRPVSSCERFVFFMNCKFTGNNYSKVLKLEKLLRLKFGFVLEIDKKSCMDLQSLQLFINTLNLKAFCFHAVELL